MGIRTKSYAHPPRGQGRAQEGAVAANNGNNIAQHPNQNQVPIVQNGVGNVNGEVPHPPTDPPSPVPQPKKEVSKGKSTRKPAAKNPRKRKQNNKKNKKVQLESLEGESEVKVKEEIKVAEVVVNPPPPKVSILDAIITTALEEEKVPEAIAENVEPESGENSAIGGDATTEKKGTGTETTSTAKGGNKKGARALVERTNKILERSRNIKKAPKKKPPVKPRILPPRASARICIRKNSGEHEQAMMRSDKPLRTVELIKRPLELRDPATKLLYLASLALYPKADPESDTTPIVIINEEIPNSNPMKKPKIKSIELPLLPNWRCASSQSSNRAVIIEESPLAPVPLLSLSKLPEVKVEDTEVPAIRKRKSGDCLPEPPKKAKGKKSGKTGNPAEAQIQKIQSQKATTFDVVEKVNDTQEKKAEASHSNVPSTPVASLPKPKGANPVTLKIKLPPETSVKEVSSGFVATKDCAQSAGMKLSTPVYQSTIKLHAFVPDSPAITPISTAPEEDACGKEEQELGSSQSSDTLVNRKRKSLESIINKAKAKKLLSSTEMAAQPKLPEGCQVTVITPAQAPNPYPTLTASSNPILEQLMKNPPKTASKVSNGNEIVGVTQIGSSSPLSIAVALQQAPGIPQGSNGQLLVKEVGKPKAKKQRNQKFKIPLPLPIPLPPGLLNYATNAASFGTRIDLAVPSVPPPKPKPKRQRKPKQAKVGNLTEILGIPNLSQTKASALGKDSLNIPISVPYLPNHLEAFYRPVPGINNGAKDLPRTLGLGESDQALDLCLKAQPITVPNGKPSKKAKPLASKSLLKPINVEDEGPLNLVVGKGGSPTNAMKSEVSEAATQILKQTGNLENVKQMLARLHTKIAPAVNGVQLITIE